jgi:hypothetical protein
MERVRFVLFATLGSVILLAGCTSAFEPKPVETPITGSKILSNTASVKNTFIMDRDTPLVVCAEPAPDATFGQDMDLDVTFALVATGGDKGGDDDEGSEESEMAGRSPSLLLARELLYRLCEFSRNYKVDKETAITLYKQNLDIIREIGGKETERTTIKIGDTVSNSSSLAVDQRSGAGRAQRRAPVSRDRSSSYDSGNSYTNPYNYSTDNSNKSSSDDDY